MGRIRSRRFEKEEPLLLRRGMEPKLLGCPARGILTVPAALFRLFAVRMRNQTIQNTSGLEENRVRLIICQSVNLWATEVQHVTLLVTGNLVGV